MSNSCYDVPITRSIKWNAMSHINALITGNRGSGKTFFAFALLATMATLPNTGGMIGTSELPTQFFIIDLKNSDMGSLRNQLPKGRVGTSKKEAIEVLETFFDLMKQRIEWMSDNTPFGATANSLKMPLYYLLIDEFSATTAAFNEGTTKEERNMKYHWFATLHQIMMLGRQVGFGVIVITQQASDVNSGLSSALKEEFGLKVHTGVANDDAYRLTFGNQVKIPRERIGVGEGLLWLEAETDRGYLLSFSSPKFNPISMGEKIWCSLANQIDNDYLFLIGKDVGVE